MLYNQYRGHYSCYTKLAGEYSNQMRVPVAHKRKFVSDNRTSHDIEIIKFENYFEVQY